MRYYHHGHACIGKFPDDFKDFSYHFRVQGACRLVEEHDLGFHHQGPDDGYTLLLSARELDGVGVCPVFQAYALEKLHCLGLCLLLAHLLDLHRGQRHVLEHGLVREEIEMLEHHAHLSAVLVDVLLGLGYVRAVEDDFSRCGDLKQVQASEEGGFSASGGADDGRDISFCYGVGHVVDCLEIAVVVILAEV